MQCSGSSCSAPRSRSGCSLSTSRCSGKGLLPIAAAAVIVSFLVLVTFDLDRPTRGLIQIPATPLLAEKVTMSLPPAASAPR